MAIATSTDRLTASTASVSLHEFVAAAKQTLDRGRQVVQIIPQEGDKIGQVFAKAVVDAALPSQIESVESRYKISLSKITTQVNTLNAQDILAFAYGILNPTTETLSQIDVASARSDVERQQKTDFAKLFNESRAQRNLVESEISTIDLSAIARHISGDALGNMTVDKLRLDLSKQIFNIDQLQEVLSKLFGTSFLEEGMRIQLPALVNPQNNTEVVTNTGCYRVFRKISKEGLMAFALEPIGAPDFVKPMILFRPTALSSNEKDALKTIAEDMHDEVGKPGFEAAREELESLIMNTGFIPAGQKGWVSGFSLGGAHAARLLAFNPNKFSKAFFFNDPSTEKAVSEEFAVKMMASSHSAENPLDIRIFHTHKDDVTLAGSMHIGHIPDDFPEKAFIRSKCRVSTVKIVTRESSDEILAHSVTDFDISFRNLLRLTRQVNRVAVARFAEMKTNLHLKIVLSSFNENSTVAEDPMSVVRSGASSPRSRSGSDPQVFMPSPRSSSVVEEIPLPERAESGEVYLNRHTVEEARRFDTIRLSRTVKVIRSLVKNFCIFAQYVKNSFRSMGKTTSNFFARFSRTHERSYIPLIEQRLQRIREDIHAMSLDELLSIPPAGNPHAKIAALNIRPILEIFSVPPATASVSA